MTLATVRRNTERIREFSALPFRLVAAVSLAGVFVRPAPQAVTGGPVNTGDTAWMLTATALVLLMTPGLSFFYGGMVRTNNVVSTMLQSFVPMGVISILWIVVGFSLAFGGHAYTFLVHCGALAFVAAFSFGGSYLLYKITDLIIPLRVSDAQEAIGLDLSQHGEVMHDMTVAPSLPVFAKTA